MPSKNSGINPVLRRSKSSTSVQTRRHGRSFANPIEKEEDQRQAQTAASLAMRRAAMIALEESHANALPMSSTTSQLSRSRSIRFSESDAVPRERHQRNSIHLRQPTPFSQENSVQEEEQEEDVEEDTSALDIRRAISEFGMLNDDVPPVPSVPSSYRKLRKSKSMFTTRLRSGWANDDSHSPKSSRNYSQETGARRFARTTLRRSMSIFKGDGELRSRRHQSTESNDDSVGKVARNQFLRDLSRTSQADTMASSFRMRRSREHKPFRRTVRSFSVTANPYESDSTNCSAQDQFTGSHRSNRTKLLTQSIRNGFRRIFKRSGSAQTDRDLHSQQCSELGNASTPNPQHDFQDITFEPYFDSASNRPASIRSMKSMDSASTSASRVTSWTNSTATNTVALRRPIETRLSIIEENGALDLNAPRKSDIYYHDRYSAFRQPLRLDCMSNGPVDSQRVYSALMRKIDGLKTPENRDGSIVARPNSVGSFRHREQRSPQTQSSSQTIRHVPSGASTRYGQAPPIPSRRSPSARSAHSMQSFYTAKTSGLTPQQIAQRNEHNTRHHLQQPLRTLEPNTSRFDTRLGAMTYDSDDTATPTKKEKNDSDDDFSTIIIMRSPSDSYAMSPSVYSRTTSGNTPSRDGGRHGSSLSDSDDDRGTATIMTSQRLPYTPRGCDRMIRGSAEWKSWMKSQMDSIDVHNIPNELDVQVASTERGHYREDAQIHDQCSDAEDTTCSVTESGPSNAIDEESKLVPDNNEPSDAERPPLSELNYLSQNNVSRPLRQSPEVPMSFGITNVKRPFLTIENHTPPRSTPVVESSLLQKVSTGSPRPQSQSGTPNLSPLAYRKPRVPDPLKSPTASPLDGLSTRSSASVRSRYGRNLPPPLYGGDVKRGFGSMRSRREDWCTAKEKRGADENTAPNRKDHENILTRLNGFHSTISSKRMVDLFLDERRRTMGGSEDSTGGSAFL